MTFGCSQPAGGVSPAYMRPDGVCDLSRNLVGEQVAYTFVDDFHTVWNIAREVLPVDEITPQNQGWRLNSRNFARTIGLICIGEVDKSRTIPGAADHGLHPVQHC